MAGSSNAACGTISLPRKLTFVFFILAISVLGYIVVFLTTDIQIYQQMRVYNTLAISRVINLAHFTNNVPIPTISNIASEREVSTQGENSTDSSLIDSTDASYNTVTTRFLNLTENHVSVNLTKNHVSVNLTENHVSVNLTENHVSVNLTENHESVNGTNPGDYNVSQPYGVSDLPNPTYNTSAANFTETVAVSDIINATLASPLDHLAIRQWEISQVKPCGPEKTILIYVYTARANRALRSRVRRSYGGVGSYCGVTLRTIFFVGAPINNKEKLQLQDDQHDVVVDTSYIDTYRNLTAKGLSALSWATTFCANAIAYVKLDDDTLFDPFRMVRLVLHIPPRIRKSLICDVTLDAGVDRNEKSKYFLSKKEYGRSRFPTYCQGAGYIWPPNGTIKKILEASESVRRLSMEDVYFTGMVAERIGLQHVHLNQNYSVHQIAVDPKIMRNIDGTYFLIRHVTSEARFRLFWKGVMTRKKACEHDPWQIALVEDLVKSNL